MTAPEPAELDAPGPDVLLQHALRVAVLSVRKEDAEAALAAARATAEPLFAIARRLGTKQQAVVLPGGVEAGMLVLKAGVTSYVVSEDELIALVAAGLPSEIEDHVLPAAATDQRVVEVLAEHCPELIETRVVNGGLDDERAVKVLAEHCPELIGARIKRGFRDELQRAIEKYEGQVPDPATGELVQVAEVTHHNPTGAFSYSGKTANAGRVRAALAAGQLVITDAGDVVAAEGSA